MCPVLLAQPRRHLQVVGFDEPTLLWVLQHAIGEELFEQLPLVNLLLNCTRLPEECTAEQARVAVNTVCSVWGKQNQKGTGYHSGDL